jgi:hypothetical protein
MEKDGGSNLKKIITILLIIMLSAVFVTPALAVGEAGQALLSKVVVAEVKQSTSNPDEIINVTVTLQNLNATALKGVMVSVSGLSSDTLSLTNTYGPFSVDLEANGTGSVSFDLFASPQIQGGNYPLSLVLTYVDTTTGFVSQYYTVTDTRNISILVDSRVADVQIPKIFVSSYSIGADRVSGGNSFEMTFTLQNTSNDVALTNIMLSFAAEANAYAPVTGASNQLYIGDIAAGGSYTGKIKLKANSALVSGIYALNFYLQYQDTEHNEYTSEAGIGIQLIGVETDDEIASPKVIVSSYDIGADRVLGGDAFEMTLVLKNTSTDAAANVLLSFVSDANAYISAPGVPNQLFVGNIAAGESYTGKLSLKANDALGTGTYNISISIEYQDVYSNPYTSITSVSIPLEQKQNLNIKSIKLPDTIIVDTKALLNVSFENPGLTDLKNLVMTLSGNIPESEKTVSIGNVKAGSSGNYDQYITPKSIGSQEITVSFTFEDASGNTYSTAARTLDFEVKSTAAPAVTDNPVPTEATGDGTETDVKQPFNLNSYWLYFVIAGVVVIAVIAVILWRVLYARKKKATQWSKNVK